MKMMEGHPDRGAVYDPADLEAKGGIAYGIFLLAERSVFQNDLKERG